MYSVYRNKFFNATVFSFTDANWKLDSHFAQIESLYNAIVSCLLHSFELCSKMIVISKPHQSVPGWSNYVKRCSCCSKTSFP